MRPYSLDFARKLAIDDSISGVSASLTVAAASQVADPDPAGHLVGSPTFVGTIVTQAAGGLVAGALYRLTLMVTSTFGRVLVRYAHIFCAPLD